MRERPRAALPQTARVTPPLSALLLLAVVCFQTPSRTLAQLVPNPLNLPDVCYL